MSYNFWIAEFAISAETTEDQANALEALSGTLRTIGQIADVCEEYGVSAEFFDKDSGRKAGSVRADGKWRYN